MKFRTFCCTVIVLLSGVGANAANGPGFFRVQKQAGAWWFVDPSGQPFLSQGVCHILSAPDPIQGTGRSLYGEAVKAKYGKVEAWRDATARLMMGWGFNSLGAWSDEQVGAVESGGRRLASAPMVDFGSGFVASVQKEAAWLHGIFPDVFDPRFETFCRDLALRKCAVRKDDPWVLGWFTDNELRWGPDWRGKDELLTMFLNLPKGTPGKNAAMELLRKRYPEFEAFNETWKTSLGSWEALEAAAEVKAPFQRKAVYAQNEGEERRANESDPRRTAFVKDCETFVADLAERYFRITRDALKAADPNHLNFGCRFAYVPPEPVRASAGRYLDAVSFNCYKTDPTEIVRSYTVLGLPLIIGEFTFRAADSGLPNTKGAGPKVATQADRADGYEQYVHALMRIPEVVGYHWFQHADQPKEGRFDGENSNYGVVNSSDDPYALLTQRMTAVNRQAATWHRDAGSPLHGEFREPFRNALREGWSWLREDPVAWRLGSAGLEIRIQPGNMWGGANNARNVLVRSVPDPGQNAVTVSMRLENTPSGQYEQVDLVWYYDDGNMVKIGQELVNGKLSLVMGREENDKTKTIAILPIEPGALEVQFRAEGRQVEGAFRHAGEPAWQKAGTCELPVKGEPKVSIQCYQGLPDVEHWARVRDFSIVTGG